MNIDCAKVQVGNLVPTCFLCSPQWLPAFLWFSLAESLLSFDGEEGDEDGGKERNWSLLGESEKKRKTR